MMNPVGRQLILFAMPAVSAGSYVPSIYRSEPGFLLDALRQEHSNQIAELN
jgi:hypothetical protein